MAMPCRRGHETTPLRPVATQRAGHCFYLARRETIGSQRLWSITQEDRERGLVGWVFFQIYWFYFKKKSPRKLGGFMIQFDGSHIFSKGGWNSSTVARWMRPCNCPSIMWKSLRAKLRSSKWNWVRQSFIITGHHFVKMSFTPRMLRPKTTWPPSKIQLYKERLPWRLGIDLWFIYLYNERYRSNPHELPTPRKWRLYFTKNFRYLEWRYFPM